MLQALGFDDGVCQSAQCAVIFILGVIVVRIVVPLFIIIALFVIVSDFVGVDAASRACFGAGVVATVVVIVADECFGAKFVAVCIGGQALNVLLPEDDFGWNAVGISQLTLPQRS